MNRGKSIQHYVPQFILRNFKSTPKNQIHVFDKQVGNAYSAAIRKVAAEYSLYDIEYRDVIFSLEDSLSKMETEASTVVKKIIDNRNLLKLSYKDRRTLAQFVAIQMLRTRSNISDLLHLNHEFCKHLKQAGVEPADEYLLAKEKARLIVISSLVKYYKEFAEIIMKKDLLLFEAPIGSVFVISDNPLAKHNTMNRNETRGTLGLISEGIELYLPITPTLTLVYFCNSIRNKMFNLM